MKGVILTALIIFISLLGKGQVQPIIWEENKTLAWADFRGKANDTSRFDAAAYAEICYNYAFYSLKDYQFNVEARFNKTISWSKKKNQNPALLQHEQLHFDIAQLYALRLKQDFENFVYSKNFKEEILEVFNRKKLEYKMIQHRYDEETNHSLNIEKQKEWEGFIAIELTVIKNRFQLATHKQIVISQENN